MRRLNSILTPRGENLIYFSVSLKPQYVVALLRDWKWSQGVLWVNKLKFKITCHITRVQWQSCFKVCEMFLFNINEKNLQKQAPPPHIRGLLMVIVDFMQKSYECSTSSRFIYNTYWKYDEASILRLQCKLVKSW